MQRSIRLWSCVAAIAALAMPARAFLWTFNDPLSGLQEVPPNNSPATGSTWGTFDDVTNMITLNAYAYPLLSGITASHLHAPAPPGANAGVIISVGVGSGGLYEYQVVNFTATLTNQQEQWLMDGLVYLNVHSPQYPGGEVRGQINLVPEPGSLAALVFGAAVLARRKRRR